jgi:acetoacetyl-CoA reductase/3-oxoacyl-[acyl-carrier protein] reductase
MSTAAPSTAAPTITPPVVVPPQTEDWPSDLLRPRMTGRVVFVTGGTRGIGLAISRSFAAQGAIVAAGYGQNVEHANAFLEQLKAHDANGSIHQGNVGSSDDCRRTIREVIDTHGRLDVLVNNAGITIDKTVLKLTDEDWYKVLAVNLSGAFFMAQAALPHMIERGTGRIINISSINGQKGQLGLTNYCAAKAGMIGFTRALALESARKGITVNAIAPGYVATDLLSGVSEEVMKSIVGQIPVGRLGKAEEVARCAVFLASDEAGWITGSTLTINGGQFMD